MRVLCHAQNLSGVGHFVRMHAIAASLAEHHDVHLVEGGRPFPRPALDAEPARIVLPVLQRDAHGDLVGADGEATSAVLVRRADDLVSAVDDIHPDVVLVDHYPFSKWELSEEIERAVAATRHANGGARAVCSLRDIAPRTRYEAASGERYDDEVLRRLALFDAVLVHSDPRLTTLPEHFPAADRITTPIRYTGVVVEPVGNGDDLPNGQWAVASAGGLDATEFLVAVADAFGALVSAEAVPAMPLHVFAPAHATPADLAAIQGAGRRGVVVHEFSDAFGAWLGGAALSISRGGYNTVAALLQSRVPAVVVPDPSVSDQRPRAAALARLGAIVAVDDHSTAPRAAALQPAILRALERDRPDLLFDLDGAGSTRDLLERLVAGEQPWAPERRRVIPTHPAFTFNAVQEELLQAALRRDGRTALRWTALCERHSLEEITHRKARRLLPLVEERLRCESAPADLPRRSIVRDARASAGREHDARVAWVAPLIDVLRQRGVEIIVLKGLSLALSYYAAPALRPMVDVDVLIRPRDINTAMRTIEAEGWMPRAPLPQNHVRRRREVDLRGPAGEKLDLHWHLHPAFIGPGDGMTDDEQFVARAVPLTVGTATTSMLDPTDLFLHVLVHGATTGWRSHPLWVADAVMLIERGPELDGDRFASLARASNVALPVVRALAYLSNQFGCVPRFRGDTRSITELARIAHAPLIRQRRIYAQIASGWATPRWLQWLLGPFASTYHYWAIQTVTWSRRRAVQEFPGWLADAWYVDSPAGLPGAAWNKLRHPPRSELGDVEHDESSRRQ